MTHTRFYTLFNSLLIICVRDLLGGRAPMVPPIEQFQTYIYNNNFKHNVVEKQFHIPMILWVKMQSMTTMMSISTISIFSAILIFFFLSKTVVFCFLVNFISLTFSIWIWCISFGEALTVPMASGLLLLLRGGYRKFLAPLIAACHYIFKLQLGRFVV